MKNYKRLTKVNENGEVVLAKPMNSNSICCLDTEFRIVYQELLKRLGELENAIEKGELISPNNVGDKEIEFFCKHNDSVRKYNTKTTVELCCKILCQTIGSPCDYAKKLKDGFEYMQDNCRDHCDNNCEAITYSQNYEKCWYEYLKSNLKDQGINIE